MAYAAAVSSSSPRSPRRAKGRGHHALVALTALRITGCAPDLQGTQSGDAAAGAAASDAGTIRFPDGSAARDADIPDCGDAGSFSACVCQYDEVCCQNWDELCDTVGSSFGCRACFPSADGGATMDPSAASSGSAAGGARQCDLTGTYVFAIRADAATRGTTFFGFPIVAASSNRTFEVITLVHIAREGGRLVATGQACGATWPDFSASIGETYAEVFPNTTWDKLQQRWSLPLVAGCLEPGCPLHGGNLLAQLGTDLPARSPWPSAEDGIDVASLSDDDGDGIPGVMVRSRGPKDAGPVSYAYPPTSLLLVDRAIEISVGFRFGSSLAGSLLDCDSFSGSAIDLQLGVRAFACRLENGLLCNADQVAFIDGNVPDWTLANGRFAAARVTEGASCAKAREVGAGL